MECAPGQDGVSTVFVKYNLFLFEDHFILMVADCPLCAFIPILIGGPLAILCLCCGCVRVVYGLLVTLEGVRVLTIAGTPPGPAINMSLSSLLLTAARQGVSLIFQ